MPRQVTTIIPSIATIGSLLLGVMAIMVVSEERYLLAAVFITIGTILDVLDGQLAVRLNAISHIGKELDSLADMVTFGVAPAIILYHLLILVGVVKYLAALAALAFVIAGAYRLARFNSMPSDRSAYFKGLPIPMACILLMTGSLWQHWVLNIWWTAIVVMVSYLMVSPFPYLKTKHLMNLPPVVWPSIMLFALFWWAVGGLAAVPFSLFLLYALSGPFMAFYTAHRWRFGGHLSL